MEIDLTCRRRNSRCFSLSVINSLHLVISALLQVATPNSIGALRPKYESSIPRLPHHDYQARVVHQIYVKASIGNGEFVKTSGHQFTLEGKALYVNGANIYWLISRATDESSRSAVTEVLQEAAGVGVTVVRTWAFADGNDYHPLQLTPGVFDESVFQGLDFVVSEAKKNGIRLILSLVNNYGDYGGKPQYVAWANYQNGGYLKSEDDFFSDATIRGWFKDYIKTVATRVNTITGVAYRDETAIFAWEMMNEPRCSADTTGNTFQAWLEEMTIYVKSMDGNHLLTTGLEGFYSSAAFPESAEQESSNPGSFATQYGVDFIRNHQAIGIDFASVHSYPDNWMLSMTETEKQEFMSKWIQTHIGDGEVTLKKPVLFAEFGKSRNVAGYTESVRVSAMSAMFDAIYDSAVEGGAGAGALVWQLITNTTTALADGFEIVLSSDPDVASCKTKHLDCHHSRNPSNPSTSKPLLLHLHRFYSVQCERSNDVKIKLRDL